MLDPLVAIAGESKRFYEVASTADMSVTVPGCPDWTVEDLVWHLAEVHAFWARIVEEKITDQSLIEEGKPERPTDAQALIALGHAQCDRLIAALRSTDDDVPVWSWTAQHDVGFVRRHQIQEAAVHRFDIESATPAGGSPIAPEIAADSIDEYLTISLPAVRTWAKAADLPGTAHIHCTDADGEWFIESNFVIERAHAKADVALRGTASDLLLALYQRLPVDALDIVGDRSVAEALVAVAAD